MLTAPQLILTAHLLNFNWRSTRYSMPDVLCSMVDDSGSSFMRKCDKVSRIRNSKRWLRTRRRIFFGNLLPSYRLRSIHDTDRITYRCFLPDLTRFMTVCCVVSNQNGLRVPFVRPLGGNSAPHKRISGKGHR